MVGVYGDVGLRFANPTYDEKRQATWPAFLSLARPPKQARGAYSSSYELIGAQPQNRLRSPYTLSARPTGGQYLRWRSEATG